MLLCCVGLVKSSRGSSSSSESMTDDDESNIRMADSCDTFAVTANIAKKIIIAGQGAFLRSAIQQQQQHITLPARIR